MIIRLAFSWWYSRGLQWVWQRVIVDRTQRAAQQFSMGSSLRTLFAPYKQTFTGSRGRGLGAWFSGLVDRSISRVVGFFVRSALLLAGLLYVLLSLISGLIIVLVFPLVPILLVVSILVSGLF